MPDTDRAQPILPGLGVGSLLLLAALAVLSAGAIEAANWADHLAIVVSLALAGVVAGAALGRSRFGGLLAALFAAVYGLFLLGWHAGLTLDSALSWHDRSLDLIGRVREQLTALALSTPHKDPLMFVLALAGVYWILSVRGAWILFRRGRFWGAVLPLGLALLINTYVYAGLRALHLYLAVFVLLALWLSVRVELSRRDAEWRRRRAHVPSEAFGSLSRVGGLVAAGLVLLAWTGPAFAESESAARLWNEITRPWREARDRVGEAFSGLRGEIAGTREPYGDRLRLGAGEEPPDELVLRVRAASSARRNGRFYWRSRVYDTYQDGLWTSDEGLPVRMEPDIGDLPVPRYAGREVIAFAFEPQQSGLFTLYLPSQPLWINRTATARILPIEGFGLDVLQVETASPVVKGETYRARASVAVPLAEELRRDSTVYPEWVVEAYLGVPAELTPQLLDLAKQITRGATNRYDQAAAITEWLRTNIEYNRVIGAPPEGVDPVLWFFFDSRVGFCNYYASSEVLMLRSLGIPARLAVGYARGAFNLDEGAYEVRTLDSHAWPEVFFPTYGWVEFEPTASQSPILRPDQDPPTDAAAGSNDPQSEDGTNPLPLEPEAGAASGGPAGRPVSWGEVLFLIVGWGGALAIGTAILFRLRPRTRTAALGALLAAFRLAGVEPPAALTRLTPGSGSPLAHVYAEWSAWLRRLEFPLGPSQTPSERARAFAKAFPEGAAAARVIVDAYHRERFGGQRPSAMESLAAWDSLERDLRRLWWERALRQGFGLVSLLRPRRASATRRDV